MGTIVGLDSGRTRSVAVLSLKGEVLGIYSGPYLSWGDIVDLVLQHGTPLIVACDVSPPTKLARKLASTFDAKLIYPSRSLSRERKNQLVRDYAKSIRIRNEHERDALASAVYALRRYRRLFLKIERLVAPPLDMIVKKFVLRKEVANIKEGIRRLKRG